MARYLIIDTEHIKDCFYNSEKAEKQIEAFRYSPFVLDEFDTSLVFEKAWDDGLSAGQSSADAGGLSEEEIEERRIRFLNNEI